MCTHLFSTKDVLLNPMEADLKNLGESVKAEIGLNIQISQNDLISAKYEVLMTVLGKVMSKTCVEP